MWYALYNNKKMMYDDDGRPTLETQPGYEPPVAFSANISSGKSDAEEQPFGSNVMYDRIILTHDMDCPINEHSLVWVNSEPKLHEGEVDPQSADYEVSAAPLDSQNVIRFAVRRRAGA